MYTWPQELASRAQFPSCSLQNAKPKPSLSRNYLAQGLEVPSSLWPLKAPCSLTPCIFRLTKLQLGGGCALRHLTITLGVGHPSVKKGIEIHFRPVVRKQVNTSLVNRPKFFQSSSRKGWDFQEVWASLP